MEKEIMKGGIDILIMSMLRKKDAYGYQIVDEIFNISGRSFNMPEGTLYLALKRLQSKGFTESYKAKAKHGKKVFYHLTDEGVKELNEKLDAWHKFTKLIKLCSEA